MLGCSKHDEIFEEPEVVVPPDETPETPPEENPFGQTAYHPEQCEVRSYFVDAAATDETAGQFYNLKIFSNFTLFLGWHKI